MPRAEPFTAQDVDGRAKASESASKITTELIKRNPDMALLAPGRLRALAEDVNEALAGHRLDQIVAEQETPARKIAALSETRNATRRLLEHSRSMPMSLRHEIEIDEAALIELFQRIETRIAYHRALRRAGMGRENKERLRQILADRLLAILSLHCPEIPVPSPRARRWMADVQRAAGLVTPDESKNPKRLTGRPARAPKQISTK